MDNLNIGKKNLDWLLSGDVSIIYQVKRDLLDANETELIKLQTRIAQEGWGRQFLKCRREDGHWGRGFYQPKWTSTHYTLLDIKNLGFPKGNEAINESVSMVLNTKRGIDGGINYSGNSYGGLKTSDVCINGMILNFGSYFIDMHQTLNDIVDFLLQVQMDDGAWNCEFRKGATHSSMHTTVSVLEGLFEFIAAGNTYRIKEIRQAEKRGVEFLLLHRLYKSHRTSEIIDPKMLRLSYPSYWHYDILRGLDHLQNANTPYDKRMEDALSIIQNKQKMGRWNLQARYKGAVHFDMEKVGEPSRWNTLRALRVVKHFRK